MHLLHEGMEVDVLLGFRVDRAVGEEQVHQHGFAAPDAAPEIEALGRRFLAAAQRQPGAPAGAAHLAAVFGERVGERLQPAHGGGLDRIAPQFTLGDQGFVGVERLGIDEHGAPSVRPRGTRLQIVSGNATEECTLDRWDPPTSLNFSIDHIHSETAYGFSIQPISNDAQFLIALELERSLRAWQRPFASLYRWRLRKFGARIVSNLLTRIQPLGS